MPKSVQISLDLFLDLVEYFSNLEKSDWETDILQQQLSEKLDKLIDHAIFTEYKRATTPAEREAYRTKYLDRRGISKSFRSDKELRKEEL